MSEFTAQLENVYGFLTIFGVITFAIIGMLYKIVPFLVWYAAYSKHVGRSKVPALGGLYSPEWQAVGYWSFLIALVACSVTSLLQIESAVQWSCVLLLGSLFTFGVNLCKILRHLVRPQVNNSLICAHV